MATPSRIAPGSERRQYPRRACRLPIVIVCDGVAAPIACETVDLSVGGVRVRAWSRIPIGSCQLSIDPPDGLSFAGQVLDETIDMATGAVTARIAFGYAPAAARARLGALTGLVVAAPSKRGRKRVLAISSLGLLVLAGAVRVGVDADTGTGSDVGAQAAHPGPVVGAQELTTLPESLLAPPTEVTSGAPPSTATSGAPASTVTRVEQADSAVRVHLAQDPDDTAVASSVGPSEGFDDVRVHLDVILPQEGTALRVAVVVENRRSERLAFPDGLTGVVTATRDGGVAATATLSSDVAEVAPGEIVSIEGVIDFGAPGDYDLGVEVETSTPADGNGSTTS